VIPAPKSLVLTVRGAFDAAATLWDGGRKTGVVLIHGLLGSRTMREVVTLAEGLAERHDVLALDVRGHGETPGRFTWGREEWREVEAAAAWLGADRRVFAVGFSFGGFHAIRAAARGAPIERIALVGAPADLRVLDHFPFGPKLWRHVPAVLGRGRRRLRAELPRRNALGDDELARVRVPVLVIHGGGDWLISERHARRYLAALPDARRKDIPGGFHGEYLVHSHGGALAAALREFLG
jgi:pimeloyl-ACP methyl ester carboxylesterase